MSSRYRFSDPGWLWLTLLSAGAGCNALFDITSPQHKPDDGVIACTLPSDCAALPGDVCLFARCSPPCKADVDCTSTGTRCLHTSTGTACVTQAQAACGNGGHDCPDGTTCQDGACYGTCSISSPCADGHTCVDDVCIGPAETGAGGMSGASGNDGTGGSTGLTVVISSPGDTYYTNGSVTIQGVVSGGDPDAIDLVVDDTLYAKLPSTAQYTWDTTGVAEGSHQIVLRALLGPEQFDSAPRTVVVDRTPPTVVSTVPAASAKNVFLDAAISATFSEPLLPTSVQPGAATLSVDGSDIKSAFSLSPDGNTLSLARQGSVAVPSTLTALLSSNLKDLAGNALAAPFSWSFDAPAWVLLGSGLNPVMGQTVTSCQIGPVDAEGNPSLVIVEPDATGPNSSAYFERWNGHEWIQVGDRLNTVDGQSVDRAYGFPFSTPMALLHVSNGPQASAQQWSGTAWSSVGAPINRETGQRPSALAAAAGPDGSIGVVLLESDPMGHANAYVQTWSGTAWQTLGGKLNRFTDMRDVSTVAIAMNASGQPAVALSESDGTHVNVYVAQWSGSAWSWLPDSDTTGLNVTDQDVISPSIAFESGGNPVIDFAEVDGSGVTNAYAFRWTGSKWGQLGGLINAVPGQDIAFSNATLALTSTNKPLVLVREGMNLNSSVSAYVMHLDNNTWSPLGGLVTPVSGRSTSTTTMLSDDKGRPMLGILLNTGTIRNCYVERSNQ